MSIVAEANLAGVAVLGLMAGVGIGVGIRIFDWIMQEVFHEGEGHRHE